MSVYLGDIVKAWVIREPGGGRRSSGWRTCPFRNLAAVHGGEAADMTPAQLQHHVELVETGTLDIRTGPVFEFDEPIQAHTLMDEGRA
jgi:hypothetical protein